MKSLILTTILVGLISSTSVSAYENNNDRSQMKSEKKAAKMAEVKTKILSRIEGRIQKLEAAKSCINSAQSREELKACKPKREKRQGNSERTRQNGDKG